jgi:hypothetical protein
MEEKEACSGTQKKVAPTHHEPPLPRIAKGMVCRWTGTQAKEKKFRPKAKIGIPGSLLQNKKKHRMPAFPLLVRLEILYPNCTMKHRH